MKISTDRLTASPTAYDFEAGTPWWQQRMPRQAGLPAALDRPFAIHVEGHVMGEDVYLEGRLEGELALECGRCLARYRQRLREPFRLVLEPAGSREPADPEAARALRETGLCLEDAFETGWYRGPEIQLDAVCLEVISLALPVQPLCKAECAGLCSACGKDLNQGDCGCEPERPPSPFDVLATLRDGETKGVN